MSSQPASAWGAPLYTTWCMSRINRFRRHWPGWTTAAFQSSSLVLPSQFCTTVWLVTRYLVSKSISIITMINLDASFLTTLCFTLSIVYKQFYMSFLGLACLGCFTVTLMPRFDKPEYIKVRGVMFIVLGLSTASMFFMFTFMKEYIVPHSAFIYALGGYIYI